MLSEHDSKAAVEKALYRVLKTLETRCAPHVWDARVCIVVAAAAFVLCQLPFRDAVLETL